jgi:hypothetical protein
MSLTAATLWHLGNRVLSLARIGNATREEHKEIGRLVESAVSLAVCKNPDAVGVSDVVAAFEPVLQTSRIPGEEQAGLPKRTASSVLRFFGIHRKLPSGLSLDPLPERLGAWVAQAAETDSVQTALARIDYQGGPPTAEELGQRFSDAFLVELLSRPDIPYRERLTAQLAAEEYTRDFAARTLLNRAGRLGLLSTGAGAAAYGIIDNATSTGDARAGLYAAGVATATYAVGAATDAVRKRTSSEQGVVRDTARAWLADLLAALFPDSDHASTNSLITAFGSALQHDLVSWTSKSDAVDEVDGDGHALLARPPPELVADLTQRLIPRAREARDEHLLAALIQLEDRLVRWDRADDDRRDTARRNVYPAILATIDAS